MTGKIIWTNIIVRLGDLKPWPKNPRMITRDQARRLAESFSEFGQVETIAVSPTLDVYNGHQRLAVLMQQHGADYQVEARQSSRALTEKEREKLTVYLHKGAAGEWDFDTLANEFDFAELVEWGFKGYELGVPGEQDNPEDEWQGMPEFHQENQKPYKSIIVHFDALEDIKNFAELVGQTVTEKTKFIWYPKKVPADLLRLVAHDES